MKQSWIIFLGATLVGFIAIIAVSKLWHAPWYLAAILLICGTVLWLPLLWGTMALYVKKFLRLIEP